MIDLVMIACREAEDREMVVDFIRVLAEQLNKIIEEEQKNAEKD